MTKSVGYIINRISITIICISCFLPKVHLFTDKLTLPKFYLSILGWSVLAVSNSIVSMKPDNKDDFHTMVEFGMIAYASAACMECLYVMHEAISLNSFSLAQSGTFDNPAGLALSICVALPYTAWRALSSNVAWTKAACAITSLLFFSVIVMSGSRTGLLSSALCITCLILHTVRSRVSMKRWMKCGAAIFAALMIVTVVTHVFVSKRDSTSGRTFILQQSLGMVKERPVFGWGKGGFERTYMSKQADYFKGNPNSEHAVLADEVQHPLNEYVYNQVNFGIAGTLFLLAALFVPIIASMRKKCHVSRPIVMALVSVAVFSCFSYPFHYPASWIVVVLAWAAIISSFITDVFSPWHSSSKLGSAHLAERKRSPKCINMLKRKVSCSILLSSGLAVLTATFVDAYHEYRWCTSFKQSVRGNHSDALRGYEGVYGYFSHDRYFLYSYSMAAFMASDFNRAYQLAEECSKYWSSYNVQLLSGDISLYRKKYDAAERHFHTASMMCPVRFAPLEGLYKVYETKGDTERMDSVAQLINEKTVKIVSSDVSRIKDACKGNVLNRKNQNH